MKLQELFVRLLAMVVLRVRVAWTKSYDPSVFVRSIVMTT